MYKGVHPEWWPRTLGTVTNSLGLLFLYLFLRHDYATQLWIAWNLLCRPRQFVFAEIPLLLLPECWVYTYVSPGLNSLHSFHKAITTFCFCCCFLVFGDVSLYYVRSTPIFFLYENILEKPSYLSQMCRKWRWGGCSLWSRLENSTGTFTKRPLIFIVLKWQMQLFCVCVCVHVVYLCGICAGMHTEVRDRYYAISK